MSRRRIAVITARADDSEQKEILCGIAEAALSMDSDVVVYSNIYNHWTEDEALNYENIIYSLFEPFHFDGVIISAEAFRDISVLDEVTEKIRKAKLPAAIIGGECDGFISVYSDEGADMEAMAEHLISEHGFTDIDILTGPMGDRSAEIRADGCKRAFRKHGIPFDDKKLHYGTFWNDSGESLAQRYIMGESPMPQAVICANDFMAYGVCDALAAAGISVPEDITVTGYDYTGGRIYHYPLLTSFRRDRRGMGHKAVDSLLGGEYNGSSGDRLVKGSSCTCGAVRSQLINELNSERIGQYHTVMSSVAQFSSRLTMCRTLSEYSLVLGEFFYLLHGADSVALCLDTAWGSGSYEGEELFCCMTDGTAPVRFKGTELPPPICTQDSAPAVYYITPVCFQTRLFGYTLLRYSYPTGYDFSFRDWSKTVADTLEFLRMKNDIHYLEQCQRASTMYDSLTGFYNLREFRQISEAAERYRLLALKLSFSENVDYLCGENFRGDVVAYAAKAIKKACVGHEVCCRAAEDVFLIMYREDEFPERLRVRLYDSVTRQFDERQVLLVCEDKEDTVAERLCGYVSEKGVEERVKLSESRQLPYYNALADIHSSLMRLPEKALSLSEAARRMCVSEGYFRRIYKQCFGVSYNQDCINARLMKARFLLSATAMSVYAVAVSCGYEDEKYFARQFRQNTGYSPMEYRKRYA